MTATILYGLLSSLIFAYATQHMRPYETICVICMCAPPGLQS